MRLFIISFVLQITFAVARTLNVKYIDERNTTGTMITGMTTAGLWVMTTKYGIEAYDNDWLGMCGYLLGAAAGIWIGMKWRTKKNA